MQLPVEQLAVPLVGVVHGMPQPPQLVLVLVCVSQPSTSFEFDEQLAKPGAHADCGTTQPPVLLHETVLVLLMCASTVQSWPQLPQFVGSVVLLTHFEPQRSGVGATQLDAQAGEPLVVEHKPVGDMHTFVQVPQCAGCVRFVSQPSSAFVVQWPKPDTQPAG
jgi:hypothetical protein